MNCVASTMIKRRLTFWRLLWLWPAAAHWSVGTGR